MTVRSVEEAYARGLTTGIHRTKGRGNRLLILHMAGPDGMIPECLRVWIRSDKTIQSEDYHHVSVLSIFITVFPTLKISLSNWIIVVEIPMCRVEYMPKNVILI